MLFYCIALLGSPLESLTYHHSGSLLIGSKVALTLSNRSVEGVVISEVEKPLFSTQSIVEIFDLFYSDPQIQTAQFMAEYYGCSLGEALNLFVPHTTEIESKSREISIPPINVTLSPAQAKALDFIRSHNVSLLFGDTGAGKSEIYMSRMDEVLSEGKRALLLLPEISLTPQMETRFCNHFGSAVVLWHSKMTPK
ncbi:MAG: primosomal protein N', partial [Sulfuricurvum sp.]|uniref:primosomal protein N' family DNA-binding protein n=1 Tax=Sulfuricurvum sp. TaxID=2025608 RepID=UPI00274B5BED|nr:primosomal protein N' [Sulfuricurvum sp.]